jgi:hypothetical protein
MHPDQQPSVPNLPQRLFRGFVEDADVRLRTKELTLLLRPAFHPEIHLLLRTSTVASALSVAVVDGPARPPADPALSPDHVETADVDSGAFRAVSSLFTRLERATTNGMEASVLGGLRITARLDAGKGVREVESRAEAGPEARALIRKLVDLAWHACDHAPVRDALAAAGRYVGRSYPVGSASLSGFQESFNGSAEVR